MKRLATKKGADELTAQPTRDTVQVMREGFEPEQLHDVIACLEEDGHRCSVFEGIDRIQPALCHPRSKLLLLGADECLPHLLKATCSESGSASEVPVLMYLNQSVHGGAEEIMTPEIHDFLLAPLNLEDLRFRVRRLVTIFAEKQDEIQSGHLSLLSHFGIQKFIGNAPAFLAAIVKIPRIASCDATVLIIGDTGTGKEMCARAIHYLSPRSDKPFIPVNCGSIPAELFENEMFGHEAGAFTDARQTRRGLIAEAEGGTLFLDEVDSLPPSAQVKLLRFLQDRQYKALGSSHYRQADIRLLAASNQDLEGKVEEGSFREDLYYRLKIVTLWLPLLRDRQEDVPPLASHFLATSADEYKRVMTTFSSGAIRKLLSHDWPGNVRELENVIRQAVVLADGPELQASDLHFASDSNTQDAAATEPLKVAKLRVIEAFERSYLTTLVNACGGNISRAAREAKKDRRSFFALLKKYNITTTH